MVKAPDDETQLLRSVADQNARSIIMARQRAEEDLLRAREELERTARALLQDKERLELLASENAQLLIEARESASERAELLVREQAARATAERASMMKDEFLANLSHELRTPLNAILGWSQLLRHQPAELPELQRGLESIERNARLQAQLIDDLLDTNRITSGKVRLELERIEPAVFVEAAVETVRAAAQARKLHINISLDRGVGFVSGDPRRLQQVVWNLLSNAVKFTPEGGAVSVTVRRTGSYAEIEVSDTGIGIARAFIPHVFERFRQGDSSTTRRFGGLGLGLSIVKELVQLHGGRVSASSDGDGQGATVTVRLPLVSVMGQEEQRGDK